MSYITAIGTANPKYKVEQSQIANFMVKAMHPDYTQERRLRAIFRSSGIDFRYSILRDFQMNDNFEFFHNGNNLEPFPSTKKRSDKFRENALALSLAAIDNALRPTDLTGISHIITVSCTGMYAPGLDIDIIKALDLSSKINRVCVNFMGCYAALNALRTADAFCKADPSAKVLIVCTEICSLHFQREPTDDNILSNAIFGDGSAAILMEGETNKSKTLIPQKFHMELMFEGEKDMAWNIGDHGFEMRLSSYVPDLVEKGIQKLMSSLRRDIGEDLLKIKYFAVHPGGKKILKAVEQILHISEDQNRPAHHVLRNYGNMSSPTVVFVLKEIFEKIAPADNGQQILSLAFGPGLTLGSVMFQIQSEP
ncbi:MAG TPA: type III polyketide synthase [Cyclobacteriaceae bacterium]|nr:type III polyketide synthase [Cyclobacteriaceae bacterium]